MSVKRFETDFAGKKLIIEVGKYALQAGAAVVAQMGGTVVMATATMSKKARDNIPFFPLMVDFEERYFAAGKIKGPRFMKREGRPSNDAILIGRMIDRGLRPLFPQDIRNDIQVICLPLSMDHENRPDIVAMIAACTAIHLSNIPFHGPVVGVRIGMVTGDYIVNPIVDELEYSDLQMVIMGDGERLMMVDCEAKDLPDEDVKKAFKVAMDAIRPIAKFIDDIKKKVGREKASGDQLCLRGDLTPEDKKVFEQIKVAALPHLDKYLFNTPKGTKDERKVILHQLEEILVKEFTPKLKTKDRDEEATKCYLEKLMKTFFFEFIEEQATKAILDREQRVDGRKLDQIRPLVAEVGVLPRTHGTGHFMRGETQVLSVCTIGAPGDKQSIETMEKDGEKHFFHHYNFLPYCVGETKPIRGAGRRDIGHGLLAEKSLRPILPANEEFPYTVRVVTEVMASNGSSSMASTCGATLALMDAGVPIKKPVAGIAMGLASDGKRWKVVTDIQDIEDGLGGMDFKFTGTKDGLTALQMDTKTHGLTMDIVDKTLVQVRKALNEILDVMGAAISKPRDELSQYAPRIIHFMVDKEKIGDIIGPGGKIIRAITSELELDIDINDDGMVMITSANVEKAKEAEKIIREIVHVVEVGDVYETAEVVKIMNFGAFIKLTPGQDGFLHVSEIEWGHVDKVTDRVNLGDKIKVKVTKIDRGKVDVSMKVFLPKPEGYVEKPRRRPPPRGRSGPGGRYGDRRQGDRPRGRDGGDRDRRRSSGPRR